MPKPGNDRPNRADRIPSVFAASRDCGGVEMQSRYLFWAKVLGEYRGGGKALDIHALEATPGILRVAEANFGWNFAIGLLLFSLVLGPTWGIYEIARLFIPSLGPSSGPTTPPGLALATGVFSVAVVLVVLNLGSLRSVGRFMLAGAFRFSRKVYSLRMVRVEPWQSPLVKVLGVPPRPSSQSWTLHCRADGEDLTVVVSARGDRLRAALDLAGQPFDPLPR